MMPKWRTYNFMRNRLSCDVQDESQCDSPHRENLKKDRKPIKVKLISEMSFKYATFEQSATSSTVCCALE